MTLSIDSIPWSCLMKKNFSQEKSGCRPFIVPVFLPHLGCPHQCAFCNQTAITNTKLGKSSFENLHRQIEKFLNYSGKKRSPVQIAFYGGNFLGLKNDFITYLLQEATKFVKKGSVDGIRFSTRPDTVNRKNLGILKDFPVQTIEIGVQSMDDRVLAMSKRGHTSLDTERSICLLKEQNYEIGMQMMVGLPGDNASKALSTGRRIVALSPDFVRIYPAVVLEKSLLAQWYKQGKYVPLSLEECITLVKNLYNLFSKEKIPVIRMGLQASDNLEKKSTILAGPYHPAFGHLVYSEIFLDVATSIIESGLESNKIPSNKSSPPNKSSIDTITIKVHPRSISKMRGLKNKNIEKLKERFNIKYLKIIPDTAIENDKTDMDSIFQIRVLM